MDLAVRVSRWPLWVLANQAGMALTGLTVTLTTLAKDGS
jgi:hypothetical protein